ncbi:SDR family NAD(P)-dependent oxidoreductase [Streptomyces chitinivorans]|uniref:SDR family NAD(P)-dependent oxidoreductase n=1 Tax=Streptomyces chitinivorans TaxID=1257027 RepID=A0ABW7HS27_9ACTN|nr:SDR family NAD(P)-dependent oxidoreductase [Streptomyces chitinivorans]MDH2408557.1 SDR family NAD(P)-dependent oxidoreductase [Streptomyces chitinivorans]
MSEHDTAEHRESRPLALVTGASSGIGLELARQFAEHGFDLLVNAEDDRLTAAAGELRSFGTGVRAVRADLRRRDEVERLWAAAAEAGRPVDAAALNAGIGRGGAFTETDLGDELALIDLNITSTVRLAKLLLRDMAARGEGRLLITSSLASTMPGPFQAVYNASKSFLQSFSEALAEELRGTGVTVTSLMPGPTDTDFFRRGGLEDTKLAEQATDDPALVARQGFEALMGGEEKKLAGSLKSRAQGRANAVAPDRLKAAAHRRMAEPGSGDPGKSS